MSVAYGVLPTPSLVNHEEIHKKLVELRFPYEAKDSGKVILFLRIPCETLPETSPLFSYLRHMLNTEIEAGNSYPQETVMDVHAFKAYFLSACAFVAVVWPSFGPCPPTCSALQHWDAQEASTYIAGMFYIKPNFPGRCSHLCNGGFITHTDRRRKGVGEAMGRAYLHLAPLLGYRASVFNLVFASNRASVQLWCRLGFKEIGRIPKAARVLNRDPPSDHFEDVLLFYYDFEWGCTLQN